MAKRKLTKREYLGEGYIHVFFHDKTGERLIIPCTQQEYERMGEVGGAQYNPVLEGYTWSHSEGGTYKVDTPDTILGDDEYCIVEDKKIVNLGGDVEWNVKHQKVTLDAIDNDDKLDESKLVKELK